MFKNATLILTVSMVSLATASASAVTQLNFELLEHGEIANDQFVRSHGVRISAVNRGGGPNLAVAFNSHLPRTRDNDLEDPWAGGNISRHKYLGKLLIIEENDHDRDGDGFIENPDDEGSRPAGSIYIEFLRSPMQWFGFDLIDVERNGEYNGHGYVGFYNDGVMQTKVGWSELINRRSPHYRPGVAYGNNYANRIAPITYQELGVAGFDMVEVNLGGSGAIDNLNYEPVPEPVTAVLGLTGLGALAWTVRRRRPEEKNAV